MYSKVFIKGGCIKESNGLAKFIDRETSSKPCIYFWVIKSKNKENDNKKLGGKVIYVGKAGKGLKTRMKQHEGGFKGGSKSGFEKNKILIKLERDYNIFVYFKEAFSFEHYDQSRNFLNLQKDNYNDNQRFKNLTFFSFEEEFYIKYFGIKSNNYLPLLNGRLNGYSDENIILKNVDELRVFSEE